HGVPQGYCSLVPEALHHCLKSSLRGEADEIASQPSQNHLMPIVDAVPVSFVIARWPIRLSMAIGGEKRVHRHPIVPLVCPVPSSTVRFLQPMPSVDIPLQDLAARAAASKATIVDAHALEKALREKLRGEVRFDDASRALYATDASNYRQVPIGVVLPRDE